MIKRNDLAKQFELVVKQEIINHNKAISENNDRFNILIKEIESIKKIDSSQNERCVAKLNTLSSQIDESITYVRKEIKQLDSKNNDRDGISRRKIDSNSQSVSQMRFNLNNTVKFEGKIKELFQKYSDLETLFSDLHSRTNKQIQDLESKYSRLLDLHKEETKAKPIEITNLDKKISNEIDICAVNIDCNGQRIDKMKKECFVMQKHMERLETHLNRLEGKA